MHHHYWPTWDIELMGVGRAFEETGFALPRQRLALDIGWGRNQLFAQPNLFLSHLHLDHALGLPRYIVNRQKMGDGQARIFAGPEVVAAAKPIVEAWQQAEGRHDPVEWVSLVPGQPHFLTGPWQIESFAAVHGIAAYGCILRRQRKTVKPQFQTLSPSQIGIAIAQGQDPIVTTWEPVLAYVGDSEITVLERYPELLAVKILMIECTFVQEFHEQSLQTRGHVLWEQLCAYAPRLQNQAIVLSHFSRRYPAQKLWEHLNKTVPQEMRSKIFALIDLPGTDDRRD